MSSTGGRCHDAFTRPGLLAALSLASGHVIAAAIVLRSWEPCAAAALCGVAGMMLVGRITLPFVVSFCIAFTGLGAAQQALLQSRDHRAFAALEALADGGSPLAQVQGRIEGAPVRTTSGWLLLIRGGCTVAVGAREASIEAPIALRVSHQRPGAELLATAVSGDWVTAIGELLELPREPGSGEPDDWLRNGGAVAALSAKRVQLASRSDGALPLPWLSRVAVEGSAAAERWMLRALPPREAALLIAMTVGRTHHLTLEQREAFRRTGLYHIFSVSGLHTMLIGGLMMAGLRLFGLHPGVRVALLAILLMGFCAFVGVRTPVVRAALLLFLFDGRDLLRRPVEPLAALGTIAALILLVWPRSLLQLDFQMSFLCMTALVFLQPWMLALQMTVGRRLGWNWRATVVHRLAQTFAASVAIQLAMTPLLLATFREVSVIAPLANVLLLGLATWCVGAGFVLMMLAPVLPSAIADRLLFLSTDLPLRLVDAASARLAEAPGAVWEAEPLPLWLAAVMYSILLGAAWNHLRTASQPRRSAWAFAPGALAVAVLFVWLPILRPAPAGLDVWFLDVGQGDAILLRAPGGRAALIDAGPESAWYLPGMLRQRGIRQLDFVVATHTDNDHIGGLPSLLGEVPVSRLYINGDLNTSEAGRELMEALSTHTVPSEALYAGTEIQWTRGVSLQVLHPAESHVAGGSDRNAASIVLRVAYAGTTLLLTGDAEEVAEATMLQQPESLRADVLKLGHHGSDSSTGPGFLRAVSPAVAIASCGRNNRFAHPSSEVLARLEQAGVAVLRTDLHGTVHLNVAPYGARTWSAARADLRGEFPSP